MELRRAGGRNENKRADRFTGPDIGATANERPATAGSLAKALGVAEELVLSALFRCRKRGLVQLDEKFRWSINPKFTSGGRKVNLTDLNSFTTSQLFERLSLPRMHLSCYFSNHSRQAQTYFLQH